MPQTTKPTQKSQIEIPAYLNVGKILSYAMYALVIFAEIVLVFRVFLLAFSANPDSSFTRFIYNTSADFLQPFRGIFPPRSVGETGYLDVSALFAIIVYGLIAWGLSALINYVNTKIKDIEKASK